MTEYKSSYRNADVLGGVIQSLWAAFPESFQQLIKEITTKHGLGTVVPERWYPLTDVLDALNENVRILCR